MRKLRFKNKNLPVPRSLNLVIDKKMPFSYVEAYKSLRTNVKFISATEKAKSFVITSAFQMEGKSNVAINLAITIAEEGKRVVLVDCDLRRPKIHQFLKINTNGKGITSVLSGESKINEVLFRCEQLSFDVLPVGVIPPNPTELLSSESMTQMIKSLKEAYDYVIIDTPPVSLVTDAAIIGNMVDGAFLVVRSDYAPVDVVKSAKKKLEDVNVRIYGVILSMFKITMSAHKYSYYNDYYYNSYKETQEEE